MNDSADILMLSGITRDCPDCAGERVFMPIDEGGDETGEMCCADCGAAVLADPLLEYVRGRASSSAA